VRGGKSGAKARSCAPQELDKTFFKVIAGRNDRVWTVGPDDEDSLITLIVDMGKSAKEIITSPLTINAAFWSFSAWGSIIIVSMIWIRVFASR
jgi:hypothetical protein